MANTLQFWLSFNNGAERLRLPVNPERISVSSTHGYNDVEVAALGEFTVIGHTKLRDFSFSSFFPRDYNPSYCEYEGIPDPWEAVALIESWKRSGRPMRLTITGTPINEAVTVRSFDYGEEGGAVGDLSFDIAFKEYAFIEFRRVGDATNNGTVRVEGGSATRPDTRQPAKSYTVKSGDSLWKIAQRTLGDGDRWRELYAVNTASIGPNPSLITPGKTLVIPV